MYVLRFTKLGMHNQHSAAASSSQVLSHLFSCTAIATLSLSVFEEAKLSLGGTSVPCFLRTSKHHSVSHMVDFDFVEAKTRQYW